MFDAEKFIQEKVRELRDKIRGKAIIGASGGADSTTSVILANKAVGESLLCVLVDNCYMRKNETENNERLLRKLGLNVLVVDAKKRFYDKLSTVVDRARHPADTINFRRTRSPFNVETVPCALAQGINTDEA